MGLCEVRHGKQRLEEGREINEKFNFAVINNYYCSNLESNFWSNGNFFCIKIEK